MSTGAPGRSNAASMSAASARSILESSSRPTRRSASSTSTVVVMATSSKISVAPTGECRRLVQGESRCFAQLGVSPGYVPALMLVPARFLEMADPAVAKVRLGSILLINYFRSGIYWYRGEREKCEFNNINHLSDSRFCRARESARETADLRSLSTVSVTSRRSLPRHGTSGFGGNADVAAEPSDVRC